MLKLVTHNLSSKFDTIKIYPLNDLHVGDRALDKKLFREFINEIKNNENHFVVLVGDLMNNAIINSVSNTYNEEMPPREQLKWLREELLPIKDKILGVVSGNHEYRSKKSTDTHLTEELCEYLGIEHLYNDEELVVKVTFGMLRNNPMMYTLYMTHGSSGGKRPGSAINNAQLLTLSVENADVYIVAHGHKKWAHKDAPRRIDAIHERIQQVEKLFVMSSHWSDFGGYAARGMFTPSAKGATPVTLDGKQKRMTAEV